MKKARLSVYLDPDMLVQLTELADRKRQSKSLIAEAAITSFLTPDDADRREAAVTRRLDLLARQGDRQERDLSIAGRDDRALHPVLADRHPTASRKRPSDGSGERTRTLRIIPRDLGTPAGKRPEHPARGVA